MAEVGGGTAAAGGQHPTGPAAENLVGSWMLSELKEGGQTIPLQPEYSYNWKPNHSEIELNYVVLVLSDKVDSLPLKGQFYRWSVASDLAVDGFGGCAFLYANVAEYPPFELLEPLSADFCPDACYAARDAFERIVLSVEHCEISNGALTLANADRSNVLTLVASDYDLSGILN